MKILLFFLFTWICLAGWIEAKNVKPPFFFLFFFLILEIKTMTAMQQPLWISCSISDMEEVEEMYRFQMFLISFAKPVQRKVKEYLRTFCSWSKGKRNTRRTEVFLPVLFPISLFIHSSSDGTGKEQQWHLKYFFLSENLKAP